MFKGMFSKGDKKDRNAKEEMEHPEVEQPVKMRGDGGAQGAWDHSRSASGGASPGGSSATPNFEWKGSPEASPDPSSSDKKPSKGFVGKMMHKYHEKQVEAKINKHCGEREPSEASAKTDHTLESSPHLPDGVCTNTYAYVTNQCASVILRMLTRSIFVCSSSSFR
jgi:hypothetical protein